MKVDKVFNKQKAKYMTMYYYIDEDKLKEEIESNNSPKTIFYQWVQNALELENKKNILEIKNIFDELDLQELTTHRLLVHLNMVFEELSKVNIERFLTSQKHILL